MDSSDLGQPGIVVTDVRINLRKEETLKAFASITFNDCFVVRGVKVIDTDERRFVAWPARVGESGKFRDIAQPIKRKTWNAIEQAVLAAYDEEDGKGCEGAGVPSPLSPIPPALEWGREKSLPSSEG
jgi:stage V sporulation protein G